MISSDRHGGRRYAPHAFTEHGAIMAATVLNSDRAIEMSVFIVLAFVHMRRAISANRQIMAKLIEIERRMESHDSDIQELMAAVRDLMTPPPSTRRRIGFELPGRSARTSRKRSLTLIRSR